MRSPVTAATSRYVTKMIRAAWWTSAFSRIFAAASQQQCCIELQHTLHKLNNELFLLIKFSKKKISAWAHSTRRWPRRKWALVFSFHVITGVVASLSWLIPRFTRKRHFQFHSSISLFLKEHHYLDILHFQKSQNIFTSVRHRDRYTFSYDSTTSNLKSISFNYKLIINGSKCWNSIFECRYRQIFSGKCYNNNNKKTVNRFETTSSEHNDRKSTVNSKRLRIFRYLLRLQSTDSLFLPDEQNRCLDIKALRAIK